MRSNHNRLVLLSSDDVHRIRCESSKARKTVHELRSYGTPDCDQPPHHDRFGNFVTQTYPAIVKWDRNNTAPDDINKDSLRSPFVCKCRHCTNQECPAAAAQASNRPKNNIMTFVDQGTMTPVLNDACCETCYSKPDVRHEDKVKPILKKVDFDQKTYNYRRCSVKSNVLDARREQERLASRSQLKADEMVQCNQGFTEPRKVLYNQGISDLVLQKFPLKPLMHIPPPINEPRYNEETDTRNKFVYANNDTIPFSHRGFSKYHQECRESDFRCSRCEPYCDLRLSSPRAERKHFIQSVPLPIDTTTGHNMRMPRKTLSSEPDLDFSLESYQKY